MIKTIVALGIIASSSAQVARRHNIRGGGGNAFGRKQRDLQLSMITGTLDGSDIPEIEDILDTIPEVPEDMKEETAGVINNALENVDLSDVPEISVAVDGVDVSTIPESVQVIESALEDSNIDIPEVEVVEKPPLTDEEKEELVAQLMVLCIGTVMKENKTEQEKLIANACCSSKDADPMLGMMCTFYN